jgi:predicted patatin/cPLA2 family phospholipase
LQGGGSHGAFTWGVLDRLLEEPWVKIEGISGNSTGASRWMRLARFIWKVPPRWDSILDSCIA